MEELTKKLEKILNGQLGSHTLTKAEGDELLKLLSDKSAAEKTKEKLGLTSVEEMTALFPQLLDQATNGENYLTRLERKMKRGELTEKLSGAFNTLVSLSQLGVSANQISKSNKELGALTRPGTPSVPTEDAALSNAIYEAGRGTFDPSRASAIASRQIRNNRLSDEATAKAVGGGQAGIYGALNQAASLRANRGYSELVPMIDSIRAREQARLDNLLAMRQQQRQNDFQNRMSIYDQANQNYMNDVNAASQLGQAGRENLFTALGGLSDNLAVVGGYGAGTKFKMPNFKRRIAATTGIKELDDYNARANGFLAAQMNPYSPTFDENWNINPQKY